MAKFLLRQKARELRKQGLSVRDIATMLHVSKGTASIWVRDIILSVEQLEKLRKSELKGAELGRLKGSLMQKDRWEKAIESYRNEGLLLLKELSEKELLLVGLALYWGEGDKKRRRVLFCNSDPKMIRLILLWLEKCFGITLEEVRCCVGINKVHEQREEVVKKYWSDVTGIPLRNFRKTSFKKVQNKKIYDNFGEHFGALAINVVQPLRIYGKIMGLIYGLAEANVAQR